MAESTTLFMATLFMDGDSQAVRLPDGFRLPGTQVRVTRAGRGVLLEPVLPPPTRAQIDAMFAELRKYRDTPFMPEGREQPPMPPDDDLPSFDE